MATSTMALTIGSDNDGSNNWLLRLAPTIGSSKNWLQQQLLMALTVAPRTTAPTTGSNNWLLRQSSYDDGTKVNNGLLAQMIAQLMAPMVALTIAPNSMALTICSNNGSDIYDWLLLKV